MTTINSKAFDIIHKYKKPHIHTSLKLMAAFE